jgi:hypothetical protein
MVRLYLFLFACTLYACAPARIAGKKARTPLEKALAAHAADFDSILCHPELYEVQIIYTQINRDATQQPHFRTWTWNVDSTRYFYPASTVKMPLALLALEKINDLNAAGFPRLHADTPYLLDSLRPFQQRWLYDASAPGGKPSIAHDIRQVFVVSDNEAYNHLFEFLGRQAINESLSQKCYTRTGIVHRFNWPRRDHRYSSPITFSGPGGGIYQQGELLDSQSWPNPQRHTLKGRGYMDARDSLVQQPFEMGKKNWFALTDMEKMLRAVLFPAAVPENTRFRLTEKDYTFLHRYMGIFPRECDFPSYNAKEYPDGYVKLFLPEGVNATYNGRVRAFNKVGEAYGTLTDVAYVVDFDAQVEFILAATILCNRDGIFNDDRYDYDSVGLPFLSKLGAAMLDYEKQRKRKVTPDLMYWEKAVAPRR